MSLSKLMRVLREEAWFWYEGVLALIPGRIGYVIRYLFYKPFYRQLARGVEIRELCHFWCPGNISIGQGSRIGRASIVNAVGGVEIGDNVRIGPRLFISTADHVYTRSDIPIKNQGTDIAEVCIGNDAWVGANVSIMKGVTIGEGAIVAAGAVVTRNVRDRSVVAGVPAEVIKERQ